MGDSAKKWAFVRRGVLTLGTAGVALVLLWKLPEWQVGGWKAFLTPKELVDLENQARETLALVLLGGTVILGLSLIWHRMSASERLASKALDTVREGQFTERFTRAIQQFGSEKLEIRLGGIYALERIAKESERDHWPIMEVLCAYVRERAACQESHTAPARVATDVQAILTILGRRRREHETEEYQRLNLSRTDLRGADLQKAHLERAALVETRLEGSDLGGACLENADLREAHLNEADLVQASLKGADLREAHLEGAYVVEAHLEGADLGAARLDGAYLGGAFLQGADLSGAHLEGAYLYKAQLDGASLAGAHVLTAVGLSREQREQLGRVRDDTEAGGECEPRVPPESSGIRAATGPADRVTDLRGA